MSQPEFEQDLERALSAAAAAEPQADIAESVVGLIDLNARRRVVTDAVRLAALTIVAVASAALAFALAGRSIGLGPSAAHWILWIPVAAIATLVAAAASLVSSLVLMRRR